jgi:Flp pilus assembly protein TadB
VDLIAAAEQLGLATAGDDDASNTEQTMILALLAAILVFIMVAAAMAFVFLAAAMFVIGGAIMAVLVIGASVVRALSR